MTLQIGGASGLGPSYQSLPYNDPQPPIATRASFESGVRGQQPQAIDHDLALLSQDVYQAGASGPIGQGGWTRVSDTDLAAAGITAATSRDDTGFQSAVYTDGNGNYVVAFAGTDPTSVPDWLANGGQGLGFETSQYRDAMALAQEVTSAFPGRTVITGHSLGGGLASAAALATDSAAVTFNSAGLSDETLRSLNLNPNGAREYAADGLVRRYTVENDILTGLQSGVSPLPEAVGHQLQLENTYLIQDPIRAHLMDAVLNGLQAGDPTPVERAPLVDALARPGEVAFDLLGNGIRETLGLAGDVASAGGEVLQGLGEAGRDVLAGRPLDAVAGLVGDVADAGLQVVGDTVDHGLNAAGDVVHGAGTLVGGWIRDLGGAVGLDGVGNTVGGWVEGATQWAGNGLDSVGSWASEKLDAAGDWVNGALETAGDWATETLGEARDWAVETASDVAGWVGDRASDAAEWVGDRASDVGDWAGDRWNDFKESNWNPANWF